MNSVSFFFMHSLPLQSNIHFYMLDELETQYQWPVGYFDLFDNWEGEPLKRPEQLPVETRLDLEI
jgi:hypothetical protein